MTDKKKDDIGRAVNVADVEETPAYIERALVQLASHSILKVIFVVLINKDFKYSGLIMLFDQPISQK